MKAGICFAGIGGDALGLERVGFENRWFIEDDEYCQRVLKKHWPTVPCYGDIRAVGDGLEWVDLIAGGFPCQDISVAGKGEGIYGDRSILWFEMLRVIRAVRPHYVLVENVPALLGRGLGRVLGDLAESGYDAEWDCLPAAAFGAPHRRNRLFIVAYPDGKGLERIHNAGDGIDLQPIEGAFPNFEWETTPRVFRRGYGIPHRVERTRALGNAVVPQVVEWIARRILTYEEQGVRDG